MQDTEDLDNPQTIEPAFRYAGVIIRETPVFPFTR